MCQALNSPFFSLLHPFQKEWINTNCEMINAKRDHFIFEVSQSGQHLFFLIEGLVFIEKEHEQSGDMLIKNVIGKGEIFGEQMLWTQRQYEAQAIVKSKSCQYLKIPTELFNRILQNNEPFAQFFMNVLFQRLQKLESRFLALNHKSTRHRLKHLLLSFVDKQGTSTSTASKILVKHQLSLKEMGNMVRASAQTMSSILNDWKGKNILDYNKECVIIHDIT